MSRRQAKWQDDLKELIDNFEHADLASGFAAIDEVISQGFVENFFNQVDHNGRKWKPRKDKKLLSDTSGEEPHPLLIKTGKMFQAATNTSDPAHIADIQDGDRSIEIGISDELVPYAKYHHTGTKNKDGTLRMVARRVIYANDTTLNRAFQEFADAAEGQIFG